MTTIEKSAPVPLTQQEAAQLEVHVQAVMANYDFRVLTRFASKDQYHFNPPAALSRGIVLDSESTGTDASNDKVIELGMVLFEYCALSGKVYRVLGKFNQLEDPGIPIPAAAAAVNGISDEMVAGKKINDDDVAEFIAGVDLIIAHNAGFDRTILERRFPVFANLAWGCSQRQVDWSAEGISTQKLDYIAYRLGFFFDAHRAEADCLALLEVLQRPMLVSDAPALKQIIDRAESTDYRVWALDAKYDKKDDLKKRGYRWGDGTNGTEKAWHIEVSEDDYPAEIAWLKANIYFNRSFRVAVDSMDAYNRFSVRVGGRTQVMC